MSRRKAGEHGFALLIVLWSLVLLVLIVTQLTASGRTETRLASNLLGAAVAEQAADGCIFEAISHLLDRSNRHWSADGRTFTIRLSKARAEMTLRSEDGKFDLNASGTDQLAALLRKVGVERSKAEELSLAIALWRFPSAGNEANARAYRAAGRDYVPPEAAFETVGELSLVLGMTPDIVAKLRPHVTVFHEGDPDLAKADPIVRSVIETAGVAPVPSRDSQAGEVVSIDALVQTDNGSRFARHAVARVGARADPDGWRILAWD